MVKRLNLDEYEQLCHKAQKRRESEYRQYEIGYCRQHCAFVGKYYRTIPDDIRNIIDKMREELADFDDHKNNFKNVVKEFNTLIFRWSKMFPDVMFVGCPISYVYRYYGEDLDLIEFLHDSIRQQASVWERFVPSICMNFSCQCHTRPD